MPSSSGAAKAKSKVQVHYVPDAVIRIVDGLPSPPDVNIKPEGTVQFVNMDDVNWRLRLLTREEKDYADVDLFLPARSSVTVIGPENGECDYEVFDVPHIATNGGKRNGGGTIAAGAGTTASATASATRAGGGGGGTIKIGP